MNKLLYAISFAVVTLVTSTRPALSDSNGEIAKRDVALYFEAKGIKVFKNDKNEITRIEMYNCDLSKIDFNMVVALSPTLEEIELGGAENLTKAMFSKLCRFPRLKRLNLFGTDVSDDWLKCTNGLKGLEHLDVGHTKVTGEGLRYISHLTDLKDLYYSGTERIADESLKHLKKLNCLKTLYLAETRITDKGLEHLEQLPKLEKLAIPGTNVTDAGMLSLAKIQSLKTLNLLGTGISDKGLKSLTTLPNLSRLYVGLTNVTDDGVEQFRLSCPNCEVKN